MSRIVVFTGPTLSHADGKELLPEATFLPPAERGDVYRAWRRGARFIGVIDGYFEHRLSIWHKEALWVLSQGCCLYGAASMGALRAAELSSYGMVGVGRIFEQFLSGVLEDDDEVAIVHEAAEREYRPLSDALCNIRATLASAHAAGAVDADGVRELISLAQGTYYADRSMLSLLETAQRHGRVALDGLRAWLRDHPPVNQKRLDACAMIQRIGADVALPEKLPEVKPDFEYTDAWHMLRSSLDEELAPTSVRDANVGDATHELEGIPNEQPLGLPPQWDQNVWNLALERKIALLIAERECGAAAPSHTEVQVESEAFRRARGLMTPESTAAWMRRNGLDLTAFSKLMCDQVAVGRYLTSARHEIMTEVTNVLMLGEHWRVT